MTSRSLAPVDSYRRAANDPSVRRLGPPSAADHWLRTRRHGEDEPAIGGWTRPV